MFQWLADRLFGHALYQRTMGLQTERIYAQFIHLCPGNWERADPVYGKRVEHEIQWASIVEGALVDRSIEERISESIAEIRARARERLEAEQRAELEGL